MGGITGGVKVEAGAKEVGAIGILDIASINSAAALSEVLRVAGVAATGVVETGVFWKGYIYIIYEEDEEAELSM